jgi:hypothetical protein
MKQSLIDAYELQSSKELCDCDGLDKVSAGVSDSCGPDPVDIECTFHASLIMWFQNIMTIINTDRQIEDSLIYFGDMCQAVADKEKFELGVCKSTTTATLTSTSTSSNTYTSHPFVPTGGSTVSGNGTSISPVYGNSSISTTHKPTAPGHLTSTTLSYFTVTGFKTSATSVYGNAPVPTTSTPTVPIATGAAAKNMGEWLVGAGALVGVVAFMM